METRRFHEKSRVLKRYNLYEIISFSVEIRKFYIWKVFCEKFGFTEFSLNIEVTAIISFFQIVVYTVWKFKIFSPTQILREINFSIVKSSKTAILTILEALNFDFRENSTFQSVENSQNALIQSFKNVEMAVFCGLWNFPNWFHVKSEWQKNPDISTLWWRNKNFRFYFTWNQFPDTI